MAPIQMVRHYSPYNNFVQTATSMHLKDVYCSRELFVAAAVAAAGIGCDSKHVARMAAVWQLELQLTEVMDVNVNVIFVMAARMSSSLLRHADYVALRSTMATIRLKMQPLLIRLPAVSM